MRVNKTRCTACRSDAAVPNFTMAFQPIVDIETSEVYAYEALVRPVGGGTAHDVLSKITEENRYAFDQGCRVKAITLAARLEMSSLLSINFLPNAVYQPAACLQKTFEAAESACFPLHHLMFEVTENEPSRDIGHLQNIFSEYKRHGMITAIDDFGAGHSGLNMLADFQPDVLKIDMALTRAINTDTVRHEIARAIIGLCKSLNISVIAEGVETIQEARGASRARHTAFSRIFVRETRRREAAPHCRGSCGHHTRCLRNKMLTARFVLLGRGKSAISDCGAQVTDIKEDWE